MKPRGIACLTAAMATMLAGCGAHPTAEHHPGTLSRGIAIASQAPDTINPLLTQSAEGANIDNMLFDSLVNINPQLKAVPDLAVRWQGSNQGTVWTFWLNRSATWWNGHPVTAADVVWTYTLESNPKSGYPGAADDAQTIARVTAVNPHQVRFELKHPDGSFLANFCAQNTGNWILPAFLLKKLPVSKVRTSPYLNNPRDMVGTGPYTLQSYKPNSDAVLAANPRYFMDRPKVKTIRFHFFASPSTLTDSLLLRQEDIAMQISPNTAQAIKKSSSARTFYALSRGLRLEYRFLWFNFKAFPAFHNVHLRDGLAMAVNRRGIISGILNGTGVLANGIVPPSSWAYDPAIGDAFPYNPGQAAAELVKAGYSLDAKGERVDAAGKKLTIDLLINAGSATDKQIAAAVQANLQAVGVSVRITALSRPAYVHALISGTFDLALAGWGVHADPDQTPIYASNQIPPKGQNFGYYHSATVDRLLAEENQSTDQSFRKSVFFQLQQAMVNDPPGIFLYFPDGYYAVSHRVAGFHFDPAMAFYRPDLWSIQSQTTGR